MAALNQLGGMIGYYRSIGEPVPAELAGDLYVETVERKLAKLVTEAPPLTEKQRHEVEARFRGVLTLAGFAI